VGKKQLNDAIDTFYRQNPEYTIPEKWEQFNSWHGRGYDFLEDKIFYFKDPPEEMYYVTIYGDSAMQANPDQIQIAVRAVCNGALHWNKKSDFKAAEVKRVQDRFHNEVITKLDKILGVRR
jgi:hypothetical protein